MCVNTEQQHLKKITACKYCGNSEILQVSKIIQPKAQCGQETRDGSDIQKFCQYGILISKEEEIQKFTSSPTKYTPSFTQIQTGHKYHLF